MTTTLRALLGAPVVLVLAALSLPAQAPPAPSSSGRVLVLESERTLEGDIDKVGDQYRVRRSVGETWVPGDKVLRLCATREEAFTYLRSRANLEDPDERLRLAQWCQLNGLREQALKEVSAAVGLRPGHAESQRLLHNLQRAAAAPPTTPVSPAARAPVPAPTAAPPLELSGEALGLFVTKVQPILMNACASCHASGKTDAFKLTRTFERSGPSRKTVQLNVTSVLSQVNLARPEASPLLVKAVSVHGDLSQPPLKGRQAAAYRTLEDWVQVTVNANPHLRDRGTAAREPRPDEPPETRTEPIPPKEADKPAMKPGEPADPFDPVIFNRQMHGEQKGKEEKK